MSQTVEINVEVTCPNCDSREFREVEALVESGAVPQNELTCRDCCAMFTVEAVIDLACYTKERAQ